MMILRAKGSNRVLWAEDDIRVTAEGAFTPTRTFTQYTTANAEAVVADLPAGFLPGAWSFNGSWSLVDSAAKDAADTAKAAALNPVPREVPAVAFRLALAQFEFLDDVEAAIKAAVAGGDDETRVRWEYATTFERAHPLIESFRLALGKTDAEVDDLFRLAGKLA